MTLEIFAGTLAALVVAMGFVLWRAEKIRKRDKAEADEIAKREVFTGMNAAKTEQELLNEEQRKFNEDISNRLHEIPIGKIVKYRLSDGSDVMAEVRTARMWNTVENCWGWEGVFQDDGLPGFIDERRVVASGFTP